MQPVISPLASLILQVVVLLSVFPITFIAYRRLREPKKIKEAKWELSQFGLDDPRDVEQAEDVVRHELSQYVMPLTYIFVIFLALYSMTNPFIIGLGMWKGLLEELVDIFGAAPGESVIARDVLAGRLMFWCWLGAYVYAVDRIIRHYLAKDLTPNVYVAVAKRFTIAFVVGTLIGIVIGVENRNLLRLSFDANVTAVYVAVFFVGMFPENGIRWIRSLARRILREPREDYEGGSLSVIGGVGVWQEDRLDQEGIDNVQNLASANLLALVANTPFAVGQLVDWVDESILVMNTSPAQLGKLRSIGIRYGSVVIRLKESAGEPLAAATGLGLEEIRVLRGALQASTNMQLILNYRRQLRKHEPHVSEGLPLAGAPQAGRAEDLLPSGDVREALPVSPEIVS